MKQLKVVRVLIYEGDEEQVLSQIKVTGVPLYGTKKLPGMTIRSWVRPEIRPVPLPDNDAERIINMSEEENS